MDEFRYVSYNQQVVFGAGSLERLRNLTDSFGRQRFMLCANHSLRVNGHIASIENALGERLVAIFDRVQPHVQDVQLHEVFTLAVEKNADAFIGMGGGSPIGMAKAASAALEKRFDEQSIPLVSHTDQPIFPVFAIPTTYAGS